HSFPDGTRERRIRVGRSIGTHAFDVRQIDVPADRRERTEQVPAGDRGDEAAAFLATQAAALVAVHASGCSALHLQGFAAAGYDRLARARGPAQVDARADVISWLRGRSHSGR